MKHFDKSSIHELMKRLPRPFHENYYAMYSSIFDGIVTDPSLMMIPIDDHVAHRGDGVFETFKCIDGGVYNLNAHLRRLTSATKSLHINMPCTLEDIKNIVIETVRAGSHKDCIVRVLISRGPGSLGVNPYDCPSPQIYVIAAALSQPFMKKHPEGARIGISRIPVKHPMFASVKSCNYLPNMLMQKETIDTGVDFVAAFDDDGFLSESATANIGIVSENDDLVFPVLDRILSGTTMIRATQLAEKLWEEKLLNSITNTNITRADIDSAREILVVGTTHNVVMVKEFDGKPVAGGVIGPVFTRLSKMLSNDIRYNVDLRTQVFL